MKLTSSSLLKMDIHPLSRGFLLVAYCSVLLCRTVVCCYTVLIAVALLLTAIDHEIVCNGIRGGGGGFMGYFECLELVEVGSCSIYAWPCVGSLGVILFSY